MPVGRPAIVCQHPFTLGKESTFIHSLPSAFLTDGEVRVHAIAQYMNPVQTAFCADGLLSPSLEGGLELLREFLFSFSRRLAIYVCSSSMVCCI